MTRPIATLVAALFAGLAGAAHADQDRLVTVVATAEPQTQLMAMVLTMQAVKQGAAAHMLLCGPGGDLALREPPASATEPQPPRAMSPQGLLRAIMAEGATVEVCAIYLPGRDATPAALIEGVGVAKPPAMAAAMLDDGARVWSF